MKKNLLPYYLLILSVIGFEFAANSQNVAINTTGNAPYTGALLDLSNQNTNGTTGFLPPYDSLYANPHTLGPVVGTPAQLSGLMVYNTSANLNGPGLYTWFYNSAIPANSTWIYLGSGVPTVTGSGTFNYLARWTPNGTTLGIGVTQDNGTSVGINTAPVATQMLTSAQTAGANIAILGQNTAATGASTGTGVEGITAQSSGYGVYGQNNSTAAGIGVYGSASGAGSSGVSGTSTSTSGNGYGVSGSATGAATNNYGGYFSASGATNNYGIAVPAGGGNSGFGTNAPLSTLDNAGSFGLGITDIAPAAATSNPLTNAYSTIIATPPALATSYTLSLPSATANPRRIYNIIYNGNALGSIVINSPVAGTIETNGSAAATYILTTGSVEMQSDGTNWQDISESGTTFGAASGLTMNGTNVQLGGANPLLANTNIQTGGFNLAITGGGNFQLGQASTNTGTIQFMDAANANTIGLTAGATTASYNMTLPLVQGAAGTVLTDNGAGVLTWGAPAVQNAANGLTMNGTTVQLGGANPLLANTSINSAGFNLAFTGAGKFQLGQAGASTGTVQFLNAGNANTIGLSAAVTTASYNMTLPQAQGAAGTVLTDNGAGVLSWATPTVYGAANGLTMNGTNVQLGGADPLLANTSIISGGFNLAFTGAGAFQLGQASTSTGTLQFLDAANANAIGISAGATTAAYNMTLPLTQGAAGTVLTDNGAGVLSWGVPTVGGANNGLTMNGTNVQLGGADPLLANTSIISGGFNLAFTGAGAFQLGQASTSTGTMQFLNAANANAIGISAGVTTTAYNMTLPLTQGAAGTVLTDNGAGVLSWGGIAVQGANNGLTMNGTNVQLGGANPLLANTNIISGGFNLAFTGAGALQLGQGSTSTGTLQFLNATNNNSIGISAATTTAAYNMTLPTAQGAAGTVLTDNGAGVLSWGTPGVNGANNGLTVVGNNVQLGGANPLLANTNIISGGFNLALTGTGNLGIGVAPVNTADIFGSLGTQISTVALTANTTLDGTYSTILANPSGGAFTITLPTAGATNARRYYTIVYAPLSATANAVTIQALVGSIYTGVTANASLSMTGGSITVQSNGVNWYTTNDWNGTPLSGSGTLNYLARWTPNGNTLGIGVTQDNGTTVGINIAPVATQMLTSAEATAANVAILGQNTAATGAGTGIGVEGITAQSGGYGVFGNNTSTSVGSIGVYGTANGAGSSGIGVEGNSTIAGGMGVKGSNTAGSTGVEGIASGATTGGIGVQALNTASGAGLQYGLYASTTGATVTGTEFGVYSLVTGSAANNYAGSFLVSGGTSSNYAIQASNVATTAGNQYGVYGSTSGNTVTGTGYGIYGTSTGTALNNYAGYFTASGATNNYGIVVSTPSNSGFGITAPVSTMDVFGSVGHQISSAAITANTTLDGTYSTILANPTGGAFTVTLPTAGATNNRRFYTIVYSPSAATANAVTIQAAFGNIYTGSTANASLSLTGGSITVQSNGVNWYTTNDWNGYTPVAGSGTLNYLARWTPNGTTLGIGVTQDNGTTVGINTAPVATQMLTSAQTTAANIAILGQNTAGIGNSTGIGVEGSTTQSLGYGIYGNNTATSGNPIGVYGTANGGGASGIGVEGNTITTGGVGVEGIVANPGGSGGYGVQGVISGAGGGSQYGVSGSSTVTSGTSYGVSGSATGAATTNYGGYFTASGATNNYGVVVPAAGGNSGFGINAPISTVDINGSYGVGTTNISPAAASTTALGTGYSTIIATPSAVSTTYTVTLPSAAANARRIYTLVYNGSGLGTIDITSPVAGSIIENGAVVTPLAISQGSVTLQSDGANWDVLNISTSNTYGSFVGIKYITATSGAVAFDAGTNSILVKVIGGGGAGGGGSTSGACSGESDAAGSGGGAGGYVEGFVNGLTGASTYAVTIGAGGVGNSNCSGSGGNGGNTVLTITSPALTFTGNGGTGGVNNVANNVDSYKAGGAGGTATSTAPAGNYITITGATGASSLISSAGIHVCSSGDGAGTTFGPGGGSLSGREINEPGTSALSFGSGGGGAIIAQETTSEAGGNGFHGVVIIYEYQ